MFSGLPGRTGTAPEVGKDKTQTAAKVKTVNKKKKEVCFIILLLKFSF